jgi:S1-C subfamily serine protease
MRRGGERHTYSVRLQEANTEEQETIASRPPDDVEEGGTLEARLGISVEEFTADDANRMRLRNSQVEYGLMVTDVDRNGPAWRKVIAGYGGRAFDVITHVDDTEVRTKEDLASALDAVEPGAVVSLRIATINGQTPVPTRFAFVRTTGSTR